MKQTSLYPPHGPQHRERLLNVAFMRREPSQGDTREAQPEPLTEDGEASAGKMPPGALE